MPYQQLPTQLLAEADQGRAEADHIAAKMVQALREDLAAGIDPTYLWWVYGYSLVHEQSYRLASVLVSALLRLAAAPREEPMSSPDAKPADRDAFASAKLQDSLKLLAERNASSLLSVVDFDHTITERVNTGEQVETITIRWQRQS